MMSLHSRGLRLPCKGSDSEKLQLVVRVNGCPQQTVAIDELLPTCTDVVTKLSKCCYILCGDLVHASAPLQGGSLAIGDKVEASLEIVGASCASMACCHFVVGPPKYRTNHSLVRGIQYPLFCNEGIIDWLLQNVQTRAGDIVVATYPKCGTTWVEQIIMLLLNGGKAQEANPALMNAWNPSNKKGKIWPEAMIRPTVTESERQSSSQGLFPLMTSQEFETLCAPRVIKSHAPVDILVGRDPETGQLAGGSRVIVCTRNPKDACVSMYYHAKKPSPWGFDGPFTAWQHLFAAGDVESGSFFDWYAGWWHARESGSLGAEVLWLHFEDLKAQPLGEIKRIADFLGIAASAEVLEQILSASSFDAMRTAAEQVNSERRKEGLRVKEGHFRKGVTGDWKTHFSSDDLVSFEALCQEKQRRHSSIPWDKLLRGTN